MKLPTLNRKLKLEVASRDRDSAGGYVTNWTVLGEIWAKISPGTGTEAESSGLSLAKVPLKIIVRAAPAGSPQRPLPGQRLREEGRIYNILAVAEADAGARFLTLFAQQEEVAA